MKSRHYTTSRCPYHDYRARATYLITMLKAPSTPPLAEVRTSSRGALYLAKTPTGEIVTAGLRELSRLHPELRVWQYKVMPDHLHIVLAATARLDKHLGFYIEKFKSCCTRALNTAHPFFGEGYHDRICRREGQLDAMIAYVKDNPRRLFIRRRFPRLFDSRHTVVLNGTEYHMYGNILLLRSPVREAVKVSRHDTPEEYAAKQILWAEASREGGALVSPFISRLEKEAMHTGITSGASLIILRQEAFGERYKPTGALFDLCAEGRLLEISLGASPHAAISRTACLEMNRLAALIASLSPLSLVIRRR